MSLPPNPEIPHWVLWAAQDRDGAWWGYAVEPLRADTGWYENEVGRIVRLGDSEPVTNWASTLSRVG